MTIPRRQINHLSLSLFATLLFGSFVSVIGQKNYLITSNSAGGVKLGMTVSQARRALSGCRFQRSSDGDGAVLIEASCRGRQTMTFYAGEEDFGAPINEKAKIEFMEIWDSRFKTVDGVHKNMLVSVAEKRLGKVTNITLTQIESREFVEFRKKRPGISYRMYGGIYPPGGFQTVRYRRGERLWSIQVSGY